MSSIFGNKLISKIIGAGTALLSSFVMLACGGGGGSPGTTNGSSNIDRTGVSLVLLDASGVARTSLTPNGPLTAQATVYDKSGNPLPNTVVSFTLGGGLANVTPPSGTGLTDANGRASVVITVKDLATAQTQVGSAGTVTASATVGTTTYTANKPFSLGASAIAGITLTLLDSTGAAKNSLTTASPLTARATVFDMNGSPMPNTIVTFTVGDSAVLSPASGTALTNSVGVATIVVSVKDLATAQSQAGAAETITAAATVGTQVLKASQPYTIGAPNVTLKLVAPNPPTIKLNAYETTPIKVEVYADGVLFTATPVTVNFTSSCAGTKAVLPASANTVNGLAQVVYQDKGCSTTDTVTISSAGAKSITATLTIAPPVASSIVFVSAVPSDKAIVIKGAGGNGRTETAILTFQVLDSFGQPLPNQIVNFSVNPTNVVTLQAASATTDANGKVTVAVNSGTTPTTFRVIASLPNNGPSTISDGITVTTGQPVQAAFSLSAQTFNIEGWNIDNTTTNINILLADQSGNPVADGTPVVFQTDSGAIGSSLSGGCLTTNGGCSVLFRSQNPRFGLNNNAGKRAGLATVNVSTTSALYTLKGRIGVFLSGSTGASPMHVFFAGTDTEIAGGANLSTTLCGPYALQLEFDDVNYNPLPVGTKIESANIETVTLQEILPKEVPNRAPIDLNGNGIDPSGPSVIDPATLALRQGTIHTIPIKPGKSCVNGATGYTETGTFMIKVTSPQGVSVPYNFSLTYPVAAPVVTPPTCTPPQVLQNNICVTPPSPNISLALTDLASGISSSTVDATHILRASATVLDSSGLPVSGAVVAFTIDLPIATLNPPTIAAQSATALTNASGVATISILSAGISTGAATVTAKTTVNTTALSASKGFTVLVGGATSCAAPQVLVNGVCQNATGPYISIVLKDKNNSQQSNTLTATDSLIAYATLTDVNGNPVSGATVTFALGASTPTMAAFNPAVATATTNGAGVATKQIDKVGTAQGVLVLTVSGQASGQNVSNTAAFGVN